MVGNPKICLKSISTKKSITIIILDAMHFLKPKSHLCQNKSFSFLYFRHVLCGCSDTISCVSRVRHCARGAQLQRRRCAKTPAALCTTEPPPFAHPPPLWWLQTICRLFFTFKYFPLDAWLLLTWPRGAETH